MSMTANRAEAGYQKRAIEQKAKEGVIVLETHICHEHRADCTVESDKRIYVRQKAERSD